MFNTAAVFITRIIILIIIKVAVNRQEMTVKTAEMIIYR
jgi:hypothetical protein